NGSTSGGFSCASGSSAAVNDGVATFTGCSYTSASSTAYVLTASSTGLTSATASTTVSAGPAAKVYVWSGNGQSAKIGTAFTLPLQVLVTDLSGNPVAGATVKFTNPTGNQSGKYATTGTACGGAGSATSCTAVTNAQGIATSSTLTAGTTVGPFGPVASVTGATSATFSETNTNAALVFLSSAQTFTTNTGTTSGSFIIQAQDGNGNPVIQTTNLTVTLTYNKTGTVTLSTQPPTVTIPAGSSYVAFPLAASAVTGTPTFTIGATAPGYAGVTSAANTVRAGSTNTGTIGAIAPQTITSASQNATYSIVVTNPSTTGTVYYSVVNVGGLLTGETATPSGTCVQATRNGGKATITETVNIGTNRPSSPTNPVSPYALDFVVESYSQNFGGGGCGGTNTYFQADASLTVNLGASSINFNGGYGQSTTHGTAFGAPLSVVVTDANDNPVSGVLVTFTAPTTGASGTFWALTNGGTCVAAGTAIPVTSCTATTNVNGVASTLTFTANGVTGAFSVQASTTVTTPTSVTFEEENQ
ncbi:MAG: hypothetical protein WCF25_06450, partial [Acidimicrobiales bacterium]